jgi:hypothetical protein
MLHFCIDRNPVDLKHVDASWTKYISRNILLGIIYIFSKFSLGTPKLIWGFGLVV